MRTIGFNVGIVSKEPKIITPSNPQKKPFLSFPLETQDGQYKTTLYCAAYGNKRDDLLKVLKVGSLVAVSGPVNATALPPREPEGKPMALLKMVVENFELIGGLPAEADPTAGFQPASGDDVPF